MLIEIYKIVGKLNEINVVVIYNSKIINHNKLKTCAIDNKMKTLLNKIPTIPEILKNMSHIII